jgi:hypothetical protein
MKSWAQGLKEWAQWLLGEGSLPDRRARRMLAGTLAVVAALITSVVLVSGSSPQTSTAAPNSAANLAGNTAANSSGGTSDTNDNSSPNGTTSGSGSTPTSGSASSSKSARSGRSARTGSHAHTRTPRTPRTNARSSTSTTHPKQHATGQALPATTPPQNVVAAAPQNPLSGIQSLDRALAAPNQGNPTPAVSVQLAAPVAPPAATPGPPTAPSPPAALRATADRGWSRVTWSPGSDGGSAILGYNVYAGTASGAEQALPSNGGTLVTGDSYVVGGLAVGRSYYFTVVAVNALGASTPSNEVAAALSPGYRSVGALQTPVVGMASNATGGYWLANSYGAVSPHGNAANDGSASQLQLAAPIDEIVATPDGKGYWLVGSDGGIFAFGDAHYYGSMGGHTLNAIIVGMAPTPDGKGYWEVAGDGGVFAFGDADYYGSLGGQVLSHPVVGIAADDATGGYWEVTSDGAVYAYNAPSFGSIAGKPLSQPVVGLVAAPSGGGYWEVSGDGGVFAFGFAGFHGSTAGAGLSAPIAGMALDPQTGGYWLVGWDGGVFAFGAPFHGAG